MATNLTLEVAGKTDVGTKRSNNEDNFGFDTRYGIFVLCDGMGGQAAGERASKIAVDTLLEYFRQAPGAGNAQVIGKSFEGLSEHANSLAKAIQLANEAIHTEAAANELHKGMGSTIVAVLAHGNLFSIAHVGDSRIYLLRDGTIQQLTNDHSLVMEQVRRGVMTAEEAEHSEIQNIIIRSLGVEESVEPDLADLEFLPEDILLMCSDGLSRFVNEDRILEIVTSADSLEQACEQLIEEGKTSGSDDNLTCLLLRANRQSPVGKMLNSLLGRSKHHWQNSI